MTLDESTSAGGVGAELFYQWSFDEVPPGRLPMLDNAYSVSPSFVADREGRYILSLAVGDGISFVATDTGTITASAVNAAPVASAGADQNVAIGSLVTVQGGTSTDVNGDEFTYR